jgi:prolyl-tRNA synthetase
MKYSTLFGKTQRGSDKKAKFISHDLLTRGGFVAESTAGRYYFLPLGWRVHEKIKKVIKEEMDKAGAQEMITPVLHPLELWKETNRTNTAGFELMKIKDRRGAEFALGGTAEEMFVDVVRKYRLSYRDLPFNIYQFSTKFRDELRARGGLLRVREFVMKDAYSFSKDEVEFKVEYDKMAKTYSKIFDRLGLKTLMVEADNGYIGGEYCHEFQVEHNEGEGRFFVSEDGSYVAHEDVAKFSRDEIGMDEEIKPMETIEQPEWVQTMDDNVKHYGKPKGKFLKNVVYRHVKTGQVIIAVLRGDLEVNKTKLEHALNAVGQLVEASDEDLVKIGTKRGFVHSWGHKGARYIGDLSLTKTRNFIGGQKEENTDTINVNYGRDFECEILADIAMAEAGALTEDKSSKLIEKRGIEVGNIFQLGYHYSDLMKGATYIDKNGQEATYYMGCYGIGLGRTLATIAETYHDDRGLMWPEIVAPFQVHLISLPGGEEKARELHEQFSQSGIEVLWDDREESAGVKFADADLIGIPVRLVVSSRTGDKIEFKKRSEKDADLIGQSEVLKRLHHN